MSSDNGKLARGRRPAVFRGTGRVNGNRVRQFENDNGPNIPGRSVYRYRSRSRNTRRRRDHNRSGADDDDQNIDPSRRKSFPMKFETLKKFDDENISDVDILAQIADSDGFYASLCVSEKPNDERFCLLSRILAKVSQVNAFLHRHSVHSLIERVLESKFVEWLQTHLLEMRWKVRPTTLRTDKDADEQLICNAMVFAVNVLINMPGEVKKLMVLVTSIFDVLSGGLFGEMNDDASDNDQQPIKLMERQLRAIWSNLIEKEQLIQSVAKPDGGRKVLELEPLEDFRLVPVLPREEEILTFEPPRLRRNIICGAYKDPTHYLDIQFRLLREDFVWPVRDAVKTLTTSYNLTGQRSKRQNHKVVRVYSGARFNEPRIDERTGLLVQEVQFDVSSFSRMNWRTSRRLLHGSLLCFSRDNFKTMLFATVFERNENELRSGKLVVHVSEQGKARTAVNSSLCYTFIESPSYFEAYNHVLRALQNLRDLPHHDVPFEKHIVFADPDVGVPPYITKNASFDITCLCRKKSDTDERVTVADVRESNCWPGDEQLVLDEWQAEAVRQALTRQIVIIQGPPGTGKTFVGLKIARLLLKHICTNDNTGGPLMVVCYTNHALDQFLEGIAAFMPNGGENVMVRIGGYKKINERMQKFQLKNVLQNSRHDRQYSSPIWNVTKERLQLKDLMNNIMSKLRDTRENLLLDYSDLPGYFKTADEALFRIPEDFEWDVILRYWLCSLLPINPRQFYENKPLIDELCWKMDVSLVVSFVAVRAAGSYFVDSARWLMDFKRILEPHIQEKSTTLEEVLLGLELNNNNIWRTNQWLQKQWQTGPNNAFRNEENNKNLRGTNEDDEVVEYCDDMYVVIDEVLEPERDHVDDDLGLYNSDIDKSMHSSHTLRESAHHAKCNDSNYRKPLSDAVRKRVAAATPLSDAEAKKAGKNPWSLPLPTRWRLYKSWLLHTAKKYERQLRHNESQYVKLTETLQELSDFDLASKLKKMRVIGMTTTGAAKKQALLQQLRPKIVIIEEAAEVLEAHVITSISAGCEHLILIGDHKQLKPKLSVYELAKNYQLDVSLFERLINNGFKYVMLREQHRMRPEIADTLVKRFYDGLRNHISVYSKEDVKGLTKNIFFIDHCYGEINEQHCNSYTNVYEATFLVALCKHLLFQGYAADKITILTCYLAQMFEIKRLISAELTKPVRVCVVDNFQGEENEIILLSLVRSNNEGKIGFLGIDNRVCVALSRAKLGLYIIGNFEQLSNKSTLWKNIIAELKQRFYIGTALEIQCQIHGTIDTVQTAEEFRQKAPDGGCRELCNVRMLCGHVCSRRCHPDDASHDISNCAKMCTKQCDNGHECPRLCNEKCPPCKQQVTKKLPCGHEQTVMCFEPPEEVMCISACERTLSCGHPCRTICGSPCSRYECRVPLEKTLICGHTAKVLCHREVSSVICLQLVNKRWPYCQHESMVACSVETDVDKCPHPCESILQCGHPCRGTCSKCRSGRLHIPCGEPCSRILICGHECSMKCAATCPPCEQRCENRCAHSSCGKVMADQRKNATGRKCGELCPPCNERCVWRCRHHQCNLRCSEPCKRIRCLHPCLKRLKCKHPCIGVCGEPCPSLCRSCEPEKYKDLLSAQFIPIDDDKEKVMFIQLEDCKHIIEMTQLDQWFDSKLAERQNGENATEILMLQCPMCKTAVRTSQRYGSLSKQLQLDIEKVKIAQRGVPNELERRSKELLQAVREENNFWIGRHCRLRTFDKMVKTLEDRPARELTNNMLIRMENLFRLAKTIIRYHQIDLVNLLQACHSTPRHQAQNIDSSWTLWISFLHLFASDRNIEKTSSVKSLTCFFKHECEKLLNWIFCHRNDANDQMINELACEFRRLVLLGSVTKFMIGQFENQTTWKDAAMVEMDKIVNVFHGKQPFTKELEDRVMTMYQTLKNASSAPGLGITLEERTEILKAMNLRRGHWFKCRKGHIYAIGECGGAMQTSICPECHTTIGGTHHRLEQGNSVATEMDGARNAAYGMDIEADRRYAENLQRMLL